VRSTREGQYHLVTFSSGTSPLIEIVDRSPQVIGRLKAVLKALQTIAPPERQEALNARLERLAELDRGDAEIPADS
jgi:hypothetical protein